MLYRVICGRLAAGGSPGTPAAATTRDLQETFHCIHPAQLLLLELVEISPVLLVETALDWYVGEPDADGSCPAIWLEEQPGC